MSTEALSIYIHIPFCRSRCSYCDFNTYAGLDQLFIPYARALVAEIAGSGQRWSRPTVDTIYIGGGTPTLLPPELLSEILGACRRSFDVAADAEITCEANPGVQGSDHFARLRNLGANRLSLGVQSFCDQELLLLGRRHTVAESEAAYRAARVAGFDNINLDLIFGLPGQQSWAWRSTLQRVVELHPNHISAYSLTLGIGTRLGRQVSNGRVVPLDDDLAADLYLLACEQLASAGYQHYEISNWARHTSSNCVHIPGSACRHNLAYWRNEPYLGFGAGAHSSCDGRRWWNMNAPVDYIERLEAGESPVAGSEVTHRRLAMGETMMLGLRLLAEGVPHLGFEHRFGESPLDVYEEEVMALEELGLLERLPDRVRLSKRGRLLGNQVFAQFLPS